MAAIVARVEFEYFVAKHKMCINKQILLAAYLKLVASLNEITYIMVIGLNIILHKVNVLRFP